MIWEHLPTPQHIGLALAGGAARGSAHIGVLQVLEEHGIRPHFIAGTSVGALVGGLYAAGVSPTPVLPSIPSRREPPRPGLARPGAG